MSVRFGDCVLDVDAHQLVRNGRAVHLSPKAFQLLCLLVTQRPKAFSKAELHQHIWPATFVTDDSLTRVVSEIRAATGDSSRDARYIRTVHGFGYAFAETVAPAGSIERSLDRRPARYRLSGAGRDVRLTQGNNLIGRDPDADVCIEAPRVSRQHACIVVGPTGIHVDDLGSKNGTFVDGRRIEGRADLAVGAEIRIGSFVLILSADADGTPTETEPG
jgi:DNA-binding winged helix-turn-helix (wHTH) protein